MDKADLVDLPDIVDLVAERRERFIVFCDDLSFEASDPGYKSLKVALDGSIAGSADNLLIYATSNRRHLMPEFMDENLETRHVGGEIHPGRDHGGEDLALGALRPLALVLPVRPGPVPRHRRRTGWAPSAGRRTRSMKPAALLWALERGSRSGRVAWQFARDYVGRAGTRGRK